VLAELRVGQRAGNVTRRRYLGRKTMRRQYRRSLRGFVVCAAVGLVLVGVAGADSQTWFVDPVGDAGSSVDITGLRVSSSGGGLGLEATVTSNPFWCSGDGGDLPLLIAIDTDQNPDTGSAFYGTELEFAWNVGGNEPIFLRANDWAFKVAPQPFGGLGWECGPTVGAFSATPRHSASRRRAASTSSP